jgi:hypothetical protein
MQLAYYFLCNEDFQGFELHEDHLTDSAPKDCLITGGGF